MEVENRSPRIQADRTRERLSFAEIHQALHLIPSSFHCPHYSKATQAAWAHPGPGQGSGPPLHHLPGPPHSQGTVGTHRDTEGQHCFKNTPGNLNETPGETETPLLPQQEPGALFTSEAGPGAGHGQAQMVPSPALLRHPGMELSLPR